MFSLSLRLAAVVTATAASVGMLLGQPPSATAGEYGSDTCRQGFVWREAVPSDHVCVAPETRTQAGNDNAQAASRVAPNIPPPCQDSGGLPTDQLIHDQAVRCSANGYWRATITAFVHDYWVFGSDAGSSIKVEHFEDDHWVERPALSITAHNEYNPRRAGEAGNTDCPPGTVGSRRHRAIAATRTPATSTAAITLSAHRTRGSTSMLAPCAALVR